MEVPFWKHFKGGEWVSNMLKHWTVVELPDSSV